MDTAVIVIMFFLLVCIILLSELFLSTRQEKQNADKAYNRRIFDLQEQVASLEKDNRRLAHWLTFCSAENAARISEGYETQLEVLREELRRANVVKDMYAKELNRRGIAVYFDEPGDIPEREDASE